MATEVIYVITIQGKPHRAFPTLARAWIECFDQGFVTQRGFHKPGMSAAHRKHRLSPGIHVIPVERTVSTAPKKRGANSKKRKFNPENWIDAL